MGAPPSFHPSEQTLHAYGLGALDDGTSASVDSHLAGCLDCRKKVAALSGDSFLGRVRESGRTVTGGEPSLPPKSARPPASVLDDDGPPRELADHPDYEVVRELGRGGMGVVYLARNTLMGRLEVLKVVGSHLIRRAGVMERFLREIRSAARLHHPNIVAAYAAMRLGENIVLAMEYVEGDDLSRLVKTRGALPVTNACYFAYQAALGLQHAHERGMVHRDIKPANLILAREGKKAIVKVLDFGLAKATSEGQLDAGLTHEGQMLGTPDFIAPEQIVDAQKADIRADIYSLGCTLYYLLSGGAPFKATSLYELLQAHHSMDALALNLARPEVPAELAALVAKMMAKDPRRRFQTPGEVAQALTKFFKPGAQAASGSHSVIAPAPAPAPVPVSAPAPAPAATAPLPPAPAPASSPPAPPRSKASPEGVAWESLIEFKETEPSLLPNRPKPPEPKAKAEPEPRLKPVASAEGGEPPRWRWPIVAAAGAAGAVVLGIIITITIRIGWTDDKAKAPGVEEKRDADLGSSSEKAPPSKPARRFDPNFFTTSGGGRWELRGDELAQTDERAMFPMIQFGDEDWTDYDFTADILRISGPSDTSLVVRSTGEDRNLRFGISGKGDWNHCFIEASEGGQKRLTKFESHPIQSGTWYKARVQVRGDRITCTLRDNDRQIVSLETQDRVHPRGAVGLRTWYSAWRFKNIKVTAPDGQVLWEGPPAVETAAVAPAVKDDGRPTVWKGLRTRFERIGPGRWVEHAEQTDFLFSEVTRTADQLDLVDHSRGEGVFVWLREGSSEILWAGKDAKRRNFQEGRWETAPAGAKTTLAPTAAAPTSPAASPNGWTPLFNGKDLGGWRVAMNADQHRWSVVDGAIVSSRPSTYTLLETTRTDFANFRLRLEVKLAEGLDAGVDFRDVRGSEGQKFYGATVAGSSSGGVGTGTLGVGVAGRITTLAKASPVPVAPGEWFPMEIVAEGDTIASFVKGKEVARYRDAERTLTSGAIGLFARGNSTFAVRKVEIQELPSTPTPWRPLFNGKDLDGWLAYGERGVLGVGGPGKDSLGGIWAVRDGILTGTGGFSHLFTPRGDYENFRVRAEIKVGQGGDSGLYLRAATGPYYPKGYEVQVNNTPAGSRTGSFIFGPGRVVRVDPSPVPADHWFVLEAEAIDNHFRVAIDGKPCVETTDAENAYSRGHIAIQAIEPSARVEVRKLEIQEIPRSTPRPPVAAQPTAAVAGPWVPVFNGKDLHGWSAWGKDGSQDAAETRSIWNVQDGVLKGSGTASHLFSPRGDYRNFRVRATVKVNEGGNSGLFFRARLGAPVPSGYEAQINATHADPNKTGSLYKRGQGAIRPVAASPVPSNTWFMLEAEAVGTHIRIWVDGKLTADLDDTQNPLASGHVAIQVLDPHTQIQVKALEVMELDDLGRPLAGAKAAPSAAIKPKAAPAVAVPDVAAVPGHRLFNGKDLTGWDGLEGYWHARGGAVFGAPLPGRPAHTFLCGNQIYRDFELRFSVRLLGGATNSGVQFRARELEPGFRVKGAQCEIGTMDLEYPPGSLVTEPAGEPAVRADRESVAKVFNASGFNEYTILCVGKHVTIRLNGLTTVDADFPTLPKEGFIALQLHGKTTAGEVEFREVMIRDLSSPRVAAGTVSFLPPGPFSPALSPRNATAWQVGDPKFVKLDDKGLTIAAGPEGNFLLTRRADYKSCVVQIEVAASRGTESFLVLKAYHDADGKLHATTARIFDDPVQGRIVAGMHANDFDLNEAGRTRDNFEYDRPFTAAFKVSTEGDTRVYLNDQWTSGVMRTGRREMVGSAGVFVKSGKLVIRSLVIED